MRSGTLNVTGIVGFGKAPDRGPGDDGRERHAGRAADRLLDGLRSELDEIHVNGSLEHRCRTTSTSASLREGESC